MASWDDHEEVFPVLNGHAALHVVAAAPRELLVASRRRWNNALVAAELMAEKAEVLKRTAHAALADLDRLERDLPL